MADKDNYKDYRYLKAIDTKTNKYKFYEVFLNNDNSIDVNYGRIGMEDSARHQHYAPHQKNFYRLVDSKIYGSSNYQDFTEEKLRDKGSNNKSDNKTLNYKEIENDWVRKLVDELEHFQKDNFIQNFNSKEISDITPEMMKNAKIKINALKENYEKMKKVEPNQKNFPFDMSHEYMCFNKSLEDLFLTVTRKMKKVDDNLLKEKADTYDRHNYTQCTDFKKNAEDKEKILFAVEKILDRELQLYDNLETMFKQNAKQNLDIKMKKDTTNKTKLDGIGITASPVTYDEEDILLKKLSVKNWENRSNENRYVKAYKVNNPSTEKAYNDFVDKHNIKSSEMLCFHGSNVENQISILKNGLEPRPSVHGHAFGQGVYFATNSQKSAGYISMKGARWNNGSTYGVSQTVKADQDHGFLLVYKVATGDCYYPTSTGDYASKSARHDKMSVWAKSQKDGGVFRDDEVIVFDKRQCTVAYMIEISEKYIDRPHSFNADKVKLTNGFNQLEIMPNTDLGITYLDNSVLNDSTKLRLNKPMHDHGTKEIDYDKDMLKFELDFRDNKINILVEDKNGNARDITHEYEKGDLYHLAREVKRQFFNSEYEFEKCAEKVMLKDVKDYTLSNIHKSNDNLSVTNISKDTDKTNDKIKDNKKKEDERE